ncbi:MAG: pyridoxamine 5'-phosphate oxidase family protein [Candidatus Kariarchaeaceae archaeon]|jgi:nitroimidazol reductase NimA-like FMN-containing flavoprotein (pyridoxamine 5'-phosphate oxidase superfamily)
MDLQQLKSLVEDQLISSIAFVTKEGKPHNTPVWTHYGDGKLYIFSRKSRSKIELAKQNSSCMIAFNNGAVSGEVEIVYRGTPEYESIMDLPDARYSRDPNYVEYKQKWTAAIKITPTKIH